jgi:hypothetical protein
MTALKWTVEGIAFDRHPDKQQRDAEENGPDPRGKPVRLTPDQATNARAAGLAHTRLQRGGFGPVHLGSSGAETGSDFEYFAHAL